MAEETKKKILIVEDEKSIAQLVAFNLMQSGYLFETAYDGEEGLEKALTGSFDLILLDLMLPKMDGFEVCRRVREQLDTPIIILTARQEEVDRVLGLDIGADDYVTKPFLIKELIARIGANIRRARGENVRNQTQNTAILTIRGLEIDTGRYRVTRDGETIPLTKTEYELLLYMAKNPGKVFSREDLLRRVWGYDIQFGDERIVDVNIRRLRAKVEKDTSSPEYIMTRHGVGYYIK